jgi:hypothetical protein
MASSEPWNLDKRVNIAIVLALMTQTAGAVWWASMMSASVTQLREADLRHEQTMERQRLDGIGQEGRLRLLEQSATRVDERLGSMDEQLDNIAEGVNRLNDRLERLLEDRP